MTAAASALAVRITKCPEMMRALADHASPCAAVVRCQRKDGIAAGDQQVPEPWNGDVERAPLLFIASNPAIDPTERYPTIDGNEWPESQVEAFFRYRFLLASGVPGLGPIPQGPPSQYWRCVRRRAAEILDIPIDAVRPGEDYAVTEIVRCKSRNEVGVAEATRECSERYLDATLRLAGAKIVVILGIRTLRHLANLRPELADMRLGDLLSDMELGSARRSILALGHPSWAGRPRVLGHLSLDVRAALAHMAATLGQSP
jgi:hypothetical protein